MRPGLIRGAIAVGLLCAGAFGWRWWQSDERRLHRAFDGLLASVEKAGSESQLDRLGHVRDFAGFFADPFVASAKPYSGSIADGQQLMAVVDGYRAGAERIVARGVDREITLRDNGTADFYAVVELEGSGRERFRLRLAWIEEEGDWRIREAEILERLEGSGRFD